MKEQMERMILTENYFDNIEQKDLTDEVSSNITVDKSVHDWTHRFYVGINIVHFFGDKYERYLPYYIKCIEDASKRLRIVLTNCSLFDEFSDDFTYYAGMPTRCDAIQDVDGYEINYMKLQGNLRSGLNFSIDKLYLGFDCVIEEPKITSVMRFVNIIMNHAFKSSKKVLTGFNEIIVDRLKHPDYVYPRASLSKICLDNLNQHYDSWAPFLINIKPGLFQKFMTSYDVHTYDLPHHTERIDFINKDFKRLVDFRTTHLDCVCIELRKLSNGVKQAHCCYDFKNNDIYQDSVLNRTNDTPPTEICNELFKTFLNQIDSSYKYYLGYKDEYNHGISVYYIFEKTFVYDNNEYMIWFSYTARNKDDKYGIIQCLKMLRNAYFTIEQAADVYDQIYWQYGQKEELMKALEESE